MERVSSLRWKFRDELTDLVFSWSVDDIFDENLYKDQVKNIPESFASVGHYLDSFIYPLLEETRARLASSMEVINKAPFAEVVNIDEEKPYGALYYHVEVDSWRNRLIDRGRELYKILPGDILIVSDYKPETVTDLQRTKWTWNFASVIGIVEDELQDSSCSATKFSIKSATEIDVAAGKQKQFFVVFLTNITTDKRIWSALHMFKNLSIIKNVLCTNALAAESCELCPAELDIQLNAKIGSPMKFELNESQRKAIMASLHKIKCHHRSHVELIWGPPGTGKTRTISVMLFSFLRLNYRILSCAPTNVALTEVASRVVKLMKETFNSESEGDDELCPLGDILLFGRKGRMKVGSDIEEVFLDYRVERLMECLNPLNGWRYFVVSMIDFLVDCVSKHKVENELIKKNNQNDEDIALKDEPLSFVEFARAQFRAISLPLRRCMITLCTHVPRSFLEQSFEKMLILIHLLESLENLLFEERLTSDELVEIFSAPEVLMMDEFLTAVGSSSSLAHVRSQCLHVLKVLQNSLGKLGFPNLLTGTSVMDKAPVIEFCLQMASLIFCTASSSYRLNSAIIEPLNLLVIDEAAQLKECESIIPLQLPGMRHAILVGDECQLSATVNSKVSEESGFGRSLFERLSLLDHPKHLLSIQYRMHPSISCFPNSKFYKKKILDAPNVRSKSYERKYLPGRIFGTYSFINVSDGREERDDDEYSLKNMVEVAVVVKIVNKLYKAWFGSDSFLSIGVISPYAAQVAVIEDKLNQKFKKLDKFSVKVKSIDGFQGGEEDIIIISAVRANSGGSIGFLSSRLRTNVALTRARHCLWVLGNERTLMSKQSIWRDLICDAKRRDCFFAAEEDNDVSKTILDVKKELDQLDDLLNPDSMLFKQGKWKVLFSGTFRKSFASLMAKNKKSIIKLLLDLASGWRPKKKSVDLVCENSSQVVKQFKVDGKYVVCSNEIMKESEYKQVLKVWDVLPLEEIPKLLRRLDHVFVKHTEDFLNHCKEKCLEGDLEVPKIWPASSPPIIRYKNLNDGAPVSDCNDTLDGRSYVENARVSESFLLMKFYSLSSGVVNHLLSDRDGGEMDLPFEVNDEEREIIQFCKSSFILGRSGTGKTTVLTRKLFQREQIHHFALEGFTTPESSIARGVAMRNKFDLSVGDSEQSVLRQLFVTVSPKLCYAVKQHVSRLKSFAYNGKLSSENSSFDLEDMDDIDHFRDIPDSFVDIPASKYPLFVTFQKFLMMLDGTLGDSYFERFPEISNCCGDNRRSSKSVSLQTFLRTKEVNFDRFSFLYWPHLNAKLTKNLDPSRVFTEIISHIKGGLHVGEFDRKLSREQYVLMSDNRASTLCSKKREDIYSIFQVYEKMKMKRGEFDLADFVMNLHLRLKNRRLEGDKMDFVYIDEVQDLTMRQIAIFKYICRNVEEGFVFSGDTAQTIARGIDFRFEDIRFLFYSEFVKGSESGNSFPRKEKGLITEMFQLHQNFRTHAGVLRLAQSVVDLLYHFFPQSIDFLQPETSLIYGEAPILLEPDSNENAIITIFSNSENAGGKIVGFGAEQVILVRDDSARKEISAYVGNHALVLTIVECKGLEFQDVLLYNFFGSSPLKNQWRVIYEYMRERNLNDCCLPSSFPNFSSSKHNILCSELKQLYVAITRTRQRLWICESADELSKPMYDYWKKLCLVKVKKVDDSLPQAMQMVSSPAEWKSRGTKLYLEKNYEMAAMCFEKAGDINWEKRAKASSLRATADRLRSSNPKESCTILREAAEIFDSIGRAESAAACFCDLGEYERAGNIYLEKCREVEDGLKKAGECFALARRYEKAAKVYAKGNYILECLETCTRGRFFDLGLHYIESWKQRDPQAKDSPKGKKIETIKQDFLERCALNCYEVIDNEYMMKYIRAFVSMDSRRKFLKSKDCLDELLLLEQELGNFKEAAEIAKLKGNHLLEADLLAKAGHPKEASLLLLWYVLSHSLWGFGKEGWPLKRFSSKKEILKKAMSFAAQDSDQFSELVRREAKVLWYENSNLPELYQCFDYSKTHKFLRVELLSVREILDAHLHSCADEYQKEDEFIVDLKRHSEERILQNQVSVETLVYFWNLWKENMSNIFQYFKCIETEHFNKDMDFGEFCLNYFGVRRQFNNANVTYALSNPDAEWVKKIDRRSMRQSKYILSLDARQFSSAARSHCHAELLSVGLKVLDTLEAIYNLSIKKSLSLYFQSRCLVNIYQVAKFLKRYSEIDNVGRKLQSFLELSTKYFEYVFPLDCHGALEERMIALRKNDISQDLLEEIIVKHTCVKGKLTYGQIGRVMMVLLGLRNPQAEILKKIVERFEKNVYWKEFIQIRFMSQSRGSQKGDVESGSSNVSADAPKKVSLVDSFFKALKNTYDANWRVEDYISPHCFWYLVEHFLIFVCHSRGFFFTTKYAFAEWLMHLQSDDTYSNATLVSDVKFSLENVFDFVALMAEQCLNGIQETAEWIARSNIHFQQYNPLLVSRLVVTVCLLCLHSRKYYNSLSGLLCKAHIKSILPKTFTDAFRLRGKHIYPFIDEYAIAEAFRRIGNPVVIVKLREDSGKISCPNAVHIKIGMTTRKEDIMRILFPRTTNYSLSSGPELMNVALSSTANDQKEKNIRDANLSTSSKNDSEISECKPQMRWTLIQDTRDLLKKLAAEAGSSANLTRNSADISKIMVELEESIKFILCTDISIESKKENFNVEGNKMMLELKQLQCLLCSSDVFLPKKTREIEELLNSMQSRRFKLETYFDDLAMAIDGTGKDFPPTATALGSESGSKGSDQSSKASESSSNSNKNNKGIGRILIDWLS